MMVKPLWTHSHEKYDYDGKGRHFRLGADSKMIYDYTHTFIYNWMGQWDTNNPNILQ